MIIIMRINIIIIIIILVLLCSRACEGAVLEREGAADAGQALDAREAGISTLCLLSLIFSEFVRAFYLYSCSDPFDLLRLLLLLR